MEYRNLGTSGLKVSEIAYGSWITFSNQVDQKAAKDLIYHAFDLGINYIDTADVYARGEAEKFLGAVLKDADRSHYVIATKAFWPMSDHISNKGLSRKHITDSIHGSLKRLDMDYVDIFYCHRYDPETGLEETIDAIQKLIQQGKILYWGTSEWTAEQIAEAHALCRSKGWNPPTVNQPDFSLLTRKIEAAILPTTTRLGMGTASFSPLAQGVLTGKYAGGKIPQGSRGSDEKLNVFMRNRLEDKALLERVQKIADIGKKYDLSIAQTSLAWILQHEGMSSIIVGATKKDQLSENCKASGVKLSEEHMNQLNEMFPA
jgi:voltage-dependent potassium channel beta subunit